MLIGAHVSIAGGVINAPDNAKKIGCETFQIFTRSPRGGATPPLTTEVVREFKEKCEIYGLKDWVVHTPYFINFASGQERIRSASILVVREELERASLLGARYLMTHLGSYKDLGREKGLEQVISGLDKTLRGYAGYTQFLLEISAGAGDIIGASFEDLGNIINHPKLKKYNIGLCYDTQHGFASGYDSRTPETLDQTLKELDKHVGLEKLKLSHCNDSLTALGSHKDRHAHIGEGEIGIKGFSTWLNHPKLQNINLICETESDKVAQDIQTLKQLRKV